MSRYWACAAQGMECRGDSSFIEPLQSVQTFGGQLQVLHRLIGNDGGADERRLQTGERRVQPCRDGAYPLRRLDQKLERQCSVEPRLHVVDEPVPPVERVR